MFDILKLRELTERKLSVAQKQQPCWKGGKQIKKKEKNLQTIGYVILKKKKNVQRIGNILRKKKCRLPPFSRYFHYVFKCILLDLQKSGLFGT